MTVRMRYKEINVSTLLITDGDERAERKCMRVCACEVTGGPCVLEHRMNGSDRHHARKAWEMVLFSRRMGSRAFRYTTEIQWKGTLHHLMRHLGRPWGNWALWLYDKCAVILAWPATHIACSPALFVLEDGFYWSPLCFTLTLYPPVTFEVCNV